MATTLELLTLLGVGTPDRNMKNLQCPSSKATSRFCAYLYSELALRKAASDSCDIPPINWPARRRPSVTCQRHLQNVVKWTS
jgi:hypothetical protein